MDPKLKRVKKEIQERECILKLNIRTPFSQTEHIQTGAKGRNDILPFHPPDYSITNKIDSARSSKKGNSLHSIVKGMVGQRERKVVGEQLVFDTQGKGYQSCHLGKTYHSSNCDSLAPF